MQPKIVVGGTAGMSASPGQPVLLAHHVQTGGVPTFAGRALQGRTVFGGFREKETAPGDPNLQRYGGGSPNLPQMNLLTENAKLMKDIEGVNSQIDEILHKIVEVRLRLGQRPS
jgi:hypothetical protein